MKDKNHPKRPCSAYICFANEKRASVVSANPSMPHTEVMKRLGEMWQAEKNRAPYEAQALENKARYAEEMKNYVAPPEEKPKRRKDKDAPKRPKSAYLYFCEQERPSIVKKQPTLKNTEIMQALGPAWQKLSAKSKTKFEKLAAKDKERYEKEMQSYVPPKRDASPSRKKDPNAPKRPKNAFLFFSEVERARVKAAFPDYKITQISTKQALAGKQ